jgi:HNH endonuclease
MIYTDFLDDDELHIYAQAINSRAQALQKKGRITGASLRDCIYASGGQCAWCAVALLKQPFEVDHIISLGNGGSNEVDNLAVACPDCNRLKASKHPARFAQEIYARTGKLTPLLQRVLDVYKVEGQVQQALFASTEAEPRITPLDDGGDDVPPYIWGKT